jgi:hypothetical protein
MATAITQQQLALGLNTITFPTLAAFLSRQFSPCAHRRSALSIYQRPLLKKKIEFFVGLDELERRVDLLVCSLPLHRHSYIGFILAFASSFHNK